MAIGSFGLVGFGAGLLIFLGRAQIAEPQARDLQVSGICRALAEGDPYHPAYSSCCDLGDDKSRWVKSADGSVSDFSADCASWGIRPGPPELMLEERPQVPTQQVTAELKGRYRCYLGETGSFDVTLKAAGIYQAADGSSGSFEFEQRDVGHNGAFSKYKINGGSLDGFYFLQWDKGKLQVGRLGWGPCDPR